MGFRRRVRRRALVVGVAGGAAMAHHAATKAGEQQQADDEAPADDQQDQAPADGDQIGEYAPLRRIRPTDRAPRAVAHLGRAHRRGVRGGQGEDTRDLNPCRMTRRFQADRFRTDPAGTGGSMSRSRKQVLADAQMAEVGAAPATDALLRYVVAGRRTSRCPAGGGRGPRRPARGGVLQRGDRVPGTGQSGRQGVRRMGHRSRPHRAAGAQRGHRAGGDRTARRVPLPGVTVADFRDGKIRSFRTYFDDITLIEQIAGA